jgi:hypothetical protein
MAVALLISAICSAQNARDYPLQGDSFCYGDATDYTALSIVRSVRNIGPERRTPTVQPPNPVMVNPDGSMWVEQVEVIDSLTLRKGSVVKVVVPTPYGKAAYPFVAGKRYLVIATGQEDGVFREPKSRRDPGTSSNHANGPDEIYGFAAFETHQSKLSAGESPAWRIANSIADTLRDSSDEALRRTLSWLYVMRYPGSDDPAFRVGRHDFEYAERLRANLTNPSAYRKSKVYQVLCGWKVFGMEMPFLNALIEASNSPTAWTSRGDYLYIGDLQFGSPGTSGDPNYKGVTLNAESWTSAVVGSKSEPVRGFLLASFDYITNDDQNRRLAELLNDRSEGVQAMIVTHLARNLNVPDKDVMRGDVAQRFAWKNKDEVLSYWRSRYGIPGHP